MPIKPTNFNFQGFYNPTTTPVPDEIFDSLMYHLSGAELKVLLYNLPPHLRLQKNQRQHLYQPNASWDYQEERRTA